MPKILVFSGSLRTGSFNSKLAALAAKEFETNGAEVTRLNLGEYPLPIYHGDIESKSGVPGEAIALHKLFTEHQGIFIASPEYNAGLTPLLVNTIAWVSRVRENGGMATAFQTPVFALGGASPGGLGAYRGLMVLRQSLELGLNARVLPSMVTVPSAVDAFTDDGEFKNPRSAKALHDLALSLLKTL